MVHTRIGSRGFLLIELLVVIAVMAVLIGLLLPNVSSVREAAAKKAAEELASKSYDEADLCPPPHCNSLVNSQYDLTLRYPAIPANFESAEVLASGLRVVYNPALLQDGQPFSLAPWTDPNVHDPGVTTMEALAYALTDTAYAVDAADWLDGELDFVVRQTQGGQTWKLRALIAPDTQSVTVVVPEPSSWLLVAAALLGLGAARRVRPSARSMRCSSPR